MKLDGAKLRERQKAFGLDDRDERGAPGLIREFDTFDAIGQAGEGVALIESVLLLAGRTADQCHRTAKQFRQYPVPDAGVVNGNIELGDAAAFEHFPVGIGHANAGEVLIGDQARLDPLSRLLKFAFGELENNTLPDRAGVRPAAMAYRSDPVGRDPSRPFQRILAPLG